MNIHLIKEKIPFYIFSIFIFCFAIWSLVLPSFFGNADDANAASFGSATTVETATEASDHQLFYTDGAYYLLYTTSTGALVLTSSTDGNTWGAVSYIDDDISPTSSLQAGYHTGASLFTALYYNYARVPVYATSTNGSDWTTSTPYNSASFGEVTSYANDPSSNFTAIFLMDNTGYNISIITSTETIGFYDGLTKSTIVTNSITDGVNAIIGSEMDSSGVLHLAYYIQDSSDNNPNGHVVYASSSNYGTSWTTQVVDTDLGYDLGGAQINYHLYTAFSIDGNGLPGIVYSSVNQASMDDFQTTSTLVYAKKALNGSWSTTTIDSNLNIGISMSEIWSTRASLKFFETSYPLISYSRQDGNSYPIFVDNTSGSFVSTTVANEAAQDMESGNVNVAYDSTNGYVGISYINTSGVVKFATTSIVAIPTAPSSIATSTASTTGMTVTWTDNSSTETSFSVEYSTDGTNWTVFAIADPDATSALATGFSVNTAYYFRVAAINSGGASSYVTTENVSYTLANAPGTPTVGTPTSTVLPITIDTNSNPADTTYAIYNVTDSNYIAADGSSTESAVYQTSATWGADFSITGLSPNTSYTFYTIAKNGHGTATANSSASAAEYTYAIVAGTPTIGTPTITTMPITIDTNSNPSGTTYAIYNVTDSTYVAADGSSTESAVYQTSATWGADFSITGLTANTAYTFQVIARNGDSISSSNSASSASEFTYANVPSSLAATGGSTQVSLSWSGDATEYAVQNVTASTVADFAVGTSATITGLTCGTSYTFSVKGKNGDDVETEYSSTASASTNACASGGGGSSSSPAPAPVAPSLPAGTSPNAPVPVTEVIAVGKSAQVTIAGSVHTVQVLSATNDSVQVEVRSEPIIVTVKKGATQEVDVDKDGKNDLRVTFVGIKDGSPELLLTEIVDESLQSISINNGDLQTENRNVTITLSANNVSQMAISEDPTFAGAIFESYRTTKKWTVSEGLGLKRLYVRFKSAQGGTIDASDTISVVVTMTEKTSMCSLETEKAYKSTKNTSVYYITTDCTKRAFTDSKKYFTYFTSWKDVQVVSESVLASITNDTLGFMPLGPLYDPKYGALVKIVTDPRVYLLLGGEKKWITSESLFNSLGYFWNWIEDIDKHLLDKFSSGGEITDNTKHPDHTLVKYKNSPKVYKLQDGKKRHIENEAVFNSLNYRWDRIVTISDTETYPDGESLK